VRLQLGLQLLLEDFCQLHWSANAHHQLQLTLLLYPQLRRLALRFAFPCGEITGLPPSAYIPKDDLGSAYSPVGLLSTTRKKVNFLYLTTYFLAQAYQQGKRILNLLEIQGFVTTAKLTILIDR
jgi:hypothetical protein